jgi:transposase
LFDNLLERFKTKGFVKVGGKQRSDSTHVLAVVRDLNRLELVGETLRAALNRLAQVVPGWIQTVVPVSWYDRYALPFEVGRLPESVKEKQELAMQIGRDGFALLQAIYHADSPTWLRQIPAVCVLQQVWIQQYYDPEQGGVWRDNADLPPCHIRIESPYDTEARYASKGRTQWVGYKVHVTESCDAHLPHLMTDVQTTLATVNDQEVTDIIQQTLAEREVLPNQHVYEAMQTARQRQTTQAFKDQYAKRAGIEGTMSQSTGAFGLRRSRYRGLAKTHLQHVVTAAAINVVRFFNWIMDKPCAKTRTSHFAKLKPQPT